TPSAAALREQGDHVHNVLVAHGCYSPLCPCSEPQHASVARQDLEDKPAHPAPHSVLLKARLQRCSKARPLKLGRNHEGDLGEIGRGTQKIAGAADDLLVLPWPGDG